MAQRPSHVGQQLGNYRLTTLLGAGGFAQVYMGEHIRLRTQAAIKVLHTHVSPEEIEKFQYEAQTIANLVHPHIVRILDFDVTNGLPFLVMEYCPDGTLREMSSQRRACSVADRGCLHQASGGGFAVCS